MQSLDIFYEITSQLSEDEGFEREPNQPDLKKVYLVAGLRNGNVLEFNITNRNKQQISTDEENNLDLSFAQDFSENYEVAGKLVISGNHAFQDNNEKYVRETHIAQKRVILSVNPAQDKNIMSTVGYDKHLYTWHTGKNTLLAKTQFNRSEVPTCLKWSVDGKMLLVGFSEGTIYILNLKDDTVNQNTRGSDSTENDIFTGPQELKVAEAKTAVLNIEFSDNGDYMAVSYDNKKVALS